MPAPAGEVIVIEPVDNEQSGWVDVSTGATGVPGWELIVAPVPPEMHPAELFTVTV